MEQATGKEVPIEHAAADQTPHDDAAKAHEHGTSLSAAVAADKPVPDTRMGTKASDPPMAGEALGHAIAGHVCNSG